MSDARRSPTFNERVLIQMRRRGRRQIQRPITISVINMKGGVGKSTITALLSRHAAFQRNLKVLAVDLDPQANLSQAFMQETGYMRFLDNERPSIVEVFRGYVPPTQTKGATERLNKSHVLVQNTPLGGSNVQLIPSRFEFSGNLVESSGIDRSALARFLAENFADRDLIFIDCAPTESTLTMAAYSASRFVLVPVKPEYFATIGFPLLQQSLDSFKSGNAGHSIDVLGVVINNATYDGGNDGGPEKRRSMQAIRSDSAKFGWHVFRNEIPHSRGFPKMMRGDFSWLGNAPDFSDFADEFLDELGF